MWCDFPKTDTDIFKYQGISMLLILLDGHTTLIKIFKFKVLENFKTNMKVKSTKKLTHLSYIS